MNKPFMKKQYLLFSLIILTLSCSAPEKKVSEIDQWKLGWRMVLSSRDKDHLLAEAQFDSLLAGNKKMEYRFMISGLETLHELDKQEKIKSILENLDPVELQQICNSGLFALKLKGIKGCEDMQMQDVQQPALQVELIKMFVDDQAARGNVMDELLVKYNLNKEEITTDDGVTVDARNRDRLKEIFREHGFPTKAMVGPDAMHGIFLMIQHADGDPEWQKSQLTNIEQAVKQRDLDGQSYAYLYDRIMVNSGEKQLYGTQFSQVDPINKIVTLAETDRMDSLDYRRREVGMMPIDMYKQYLFKNI